MEVSFTIPDDIACRMTAGESGLSRHALEALAAEEYRQGKIHKPDLRRLFGFETSYEIDGFLKAHNVYDDFTLEEINQQVAALERLGI
ncbi:MAG TPA: UPF0175 family protein [Bryobacteraceae bacterium]|nr:UPF0175 family protein [Bryobacteraceae bacterium]